MHTVLLGLVRLATSFHEGCSLGQEEPPGEIVQHLQIVVMMLPYLYLVPYRDIRAVTADLASVSCRTHKQGHCHGQGSPAGE